MPTLQLDRHALHYRDEGNGPALILLPANPGESRDYDAVAPELARHYRVLRLDWPGYGASAAPEPPERAGASYFLDVFTRWAAVLGVETFHLVGNSVGGNVAARYALAHPQHVLSLTLVSGGGFTRHNAVTRLFCRLQGRPGFNRAIGSMFTRSYLRRRNNWTRAMIARAGAEQNGAIARRVNAAVWRSFLEPQHNLLEQARELRVPALVINGRHDPVIPARRDGRYAAEAIPGARAVVMDSGHAPFAEVPEAFLGELRSFLDAAGADRAAR